METVEERQCSAVELEWVLEVRSGTLPLDVTATVNVTSDRLSVKWRQAFSRLVETG